MQQSHRIIFFAATALGLALAMAADHAAQRNDTSPTLQTCITDSECEAAERDAQCRQDDQDDVVSIQLNVEFNCYSN